MMFRVKYGNKGIKSKYKVNFYNKLRICFLKITLLYKRFLRFAKRVFLYNIVNYGIILFVMIIACLLIKCGIKIGKYNNFIDGIWGEKDLLINNAILILFITSYSLETKRHKTLNHQYGTYYSMMCSADIFINDLLELINLSCYNSIFIDRENYDEFCIQLKKICNKEYITKTNKMRKNIILQLHNDFIKELNFLISISDKNYIGLDYDYIKNDILNQYKKEYNNIRKSNQKIKIDEFTEYILNMSNISYQLITQYRRPWRWDIVIDKKIRKILNNHGKHIKGTFNCLEYYDLPIIKEKYDD